MMNSSFIPMNELEKQLLHAQAGQMTGEAFITVLANSEVFMPIYEKIQISGFQPHDHAQPLILDGDSGDKILILFTSPERGKVFLQDFAGYGGGLLVEFKWVIEKMGVGFNISINPDSEVGLDLHAAAIAQMFPH
jgi:hypothetical protein